jgi:hypothetical protein
MTKREREQEREREREGEKLAPLITLENQIR